MYDSDSSPNLKGEMMDIISQCFLLVLVYLHICGQRACLCGTKDCGDRVFDNC